MAKRTLLRAQVRDKEYVTPGMVRLTIGGEEMYRLQSTGIGDEFIRLFFPDANGHIELPVMAEDGSYSFLPGQPRPHSEVYTVRAADACRRELILDFVVHPGGYASEWAQAALPGEALVITAPPHATFKPPRDTTKLALLCDATGLPALCRILQNLPSGVSVLAIVEIAEPAHRPPLETEAMLETIWLEGKGNGISPSGLPHAARQLLPAWQPEYVWMGGEQKAASSVRSVARQTLELPSERYSILGYWIEKSAGQGSGQATVENEAT